LLRARSLLEQLLSAETGVRGLLLTNEDRFAAPYDRAVVDVPQALGELEQSVSDNPEQQARARSLAPLAPQSLADLGQARRDALGGNRTRAFARVRDGQGQRLMDDLHDRLNAFIGEEQSLHDERQATLAQVRLWVKRLLLGGTLVGVAVVM